MPPSRHALVTGGAGYIGSHVTRQLLAAGWKVTVVDNLRSGDRRLVAPAAEFVLADAGDGPAMEALLRARDCCAVFHFAGSLIVPESVTDPLAYYANNTVGSRSLIAASVAAGVKAFVFSSTAAVYGSPAALPVREDTPLNPVNPYGRSKMMTEWMLADADAAHGLPYVSLRYFNVAGADAEGHCGQVGSNPSHLIRVGCWAALGMLNRFTIFGTDYDTPDGTCVRDFIHVTDLADAHLRAVEYLLAGGTSAAVNCGYGHGFSVREVLDVVKAASDSDFPVFQGPRRLGDPPALVADASTARALLGWTPRHDDIGEIVRSSLGWERKLRAMMAADPATG